MRSRKIEVRSSYVAKKSAQSLNSADIDSISGKHPAAHARDFTSPTQPADSRRIAIDEPARRPDRGHHSRNCRICAHPRRQEIEDDFVNWKSVAQIVREFRLGNRFCAYRHARALGLFKRRGRNVRAALELIIEHAGDVEPSASAVVAAIQTFAKINARGEWVEADEHLERHDLFDRMKPEDYAAYAMDETLPSWFQNEIAAAGGRIHKGDDDA